MLTGQRSDWRTSTEASRVVVGALPRPRLFTRLDRVLTTGTALVCAGAGYGKTTLLASWATARVAAFDAFWVSIEPAHDDQSVLSHALQVAFEGVMKLPQQGPLSSTVTALARGSASRDRPVVLVLDDADLVSSEPVLAAFEWLGTRRTPGLSVVFCAREEPRLPWHRLRARGQLVDLTASDLALDEGEIVAVLRHGYGIEVPQALAAQLRTQTEGWVAGVCLAGLMTRDAPDGISVLGTRLAHQRFVREFFEREIAHEVPSDVSDFIARTSLVPRLEPSLARRLTGRDDALSVLQRLTEENLFTEQLSPDPPTYRYHPLLAEVMSTRLVAEMPSEARRIRLLAARWFAEHDQDDAAINLAIEAGDFEYAERLVRSAVGRAVRFGHYATVARWLTRLGPNILDSSPDLMLVLGGASSLVGDQATARASLRALRQLEARATGPLSPALQVAMEQLEVRIRLGEGRLESMTTHAEAALRLFRANAGDPDMELYSADEEALMAMLSLSRLTAGASEDAVDTVSEALRPAHLIHPTRNTISLLATRALALVVSRQWRAASEAVDNGFEVVRRFSGSGVDAVLLWLAMAWVRDGEAADKALETASLHAADRRLPALDALLNLTQAHVAGKAGARALAADHLAVAEAAIAAFPEPGFLVGVAARVRQDIVTAGAIESDGTLTPREIDVLAAVAYGATRSEAARQLHYSLNTVKTHLRNAYRKLAAHDRDEALARARAMGLLPPVGVSDRSNRTDLPPFDG